MQLSSVILCVISAVLCMSSVAGFVTTARFAPAKQKTSASQLKMLSEGEVAPDFALPNQDGKIVKLSSFKKKKDVVVFFYPKDDTPGCTKEACKFNEKLDEFKKLNAEVIGISSDEDHTAFVEKYGLRMNLLSDAGGKVRKEWEVSNMLSCYTIPRQNLHFSTK
mmetsp:Transcript_27431/g.35409  ORF Transcript_27431/g.35409 Transcript_27431/m.35409 type:complete len:164 (-) Transcript_27431:507-998(-)